MATKTLIIATIKENGDWINITDNMDVEYGINKPKAPKLAASLAGAKPGQEVTGNHTEKNGKNFLWDPNEQKLGNGGKNFTPRDKSLDCAIEAAKAASTFHSLDKDHSDDKLIATAERLHAWILSKKTA